MKKLLTWVLKSSSFAFHDPYEHIGSRDYILKAVESKYSRDFSVGKLGRWLPRGKSLNSPQIQKMLTFLLRIFKPQTTNSNFRPVKGERRAVSTSTCCNTMTMAILNAAEESCLKDVTHTTATHKYHPTAI